MKRPITICWLSTILFFFIYPLEAQEPHLALERITALPYLTGTAPSSPVWSPDSRRLAFLWNREAMPFRDVYVVSAEGGDPVRLTEMGGGDSGRSRSGVSELVWSADGSSIVFVFEGDLYRVDANGGGAERLTRSGGHKYSLGFSHDGTYLSYLQDGDLWLWNQKTKELVQVTRVAVPPIGNSPRNTCCGEGFSRPEVELTGYQWSPDGRYLALTYSDRRRVRTILIPDYLGEETRAQPVHRDYPGDNDHVRDIVLYSVEEGRSGRVNLPDPTDRGIASYGWSPDGKFLLVDQFPQDAIDRWIYLVQPESGEIEELWHDRRETRTTQHWTSAWMSDGSGIVFVTDKDGRHHLYGLSLSDRQAKPLTRGEWSVIGESGRAAVSVSPKTKEIFFVSNEKNPYERHVYRMPETGGAHEQITTIAGVHHPFPSPDGSKVAVLHSSDSSPTELHIADSRGGSPERRVTHSPPAAFGEIPWVEPRYVTFPSHVDGVTLHGRLLEPPNLDRSQRYPVILGPVYPNSVRNRWGERQEWRGLFNSLQQYLVLEGQYIVFQVDVRGSVGYGRDFREKLLRDYGGIDIEDLESGVRYLKTLPYVDPERFGIWGSSYGGLMTAHSLFKKPGLYKAGVAAAPATNVWHAMTGQVNVAGRPQANPDVYRKTSAVSYGEELSDHLMIIHGMQDSVVLFKDSVTLAEKLMMLGKDFDFVIAPSAVHEWSTKDYVGTYLLRKLVGHFDRYLGRGGRR